MSAELRKGLPELPFRLRGLPIDPRGYPIPWFVAEHEGKRDFRFADERKRALAVRDDLCWLCGERIIREPYAFVIGPMCAVNRNTSEPGCHRQCALFAVQACPFMTLPEAQYRRNNLPADAKLQPGGLDGNPGASCIWFTRSFKPYKVENSWLIRLGDPVEVLWYARGRPATRSEIIESFDKRLPLLRKVAEEDGAAAVVHLDYLVEETMKLLP